MASNRGTECWLVEHVNGGGEWQLWSSHRVYGRALASKARLDRSVGVRFLTRLRKKVENSE